MEDVRLDIASGEPCGTMTAANANNRPTCPDRRSQRCLLRRDRASAGGDDTCAIARYDRPRRAIDPSLVIEGPNRPRRFVTMEPVRVYLPIAPIPHALRHMCFLLQTVAAAHITCFTPLLLGTRGSRQRKRKGTCCHQQTKIARGLPCLVVQLIQCLHFRLFCEGRTTTFVPTRTSSYSPIMSTLSSLMHPEDEALPIDQYSEVPCILYRVSWPL